MSATSHQDVVEKSNLQVQKEPHLRPAKYDHKNKIQEKERAFHRKFLERFGFAESYPLPWMGVILAATWEDCGEKGLE